MHRRSFVTALAAAGTFVSETMQAQTTKTRKGRLQQCVTKGVFAPNTPLDQMAADAARLGCKGFDLIEPADWPTLAKHGLLPTMYPPGPGGSISNALNRTENHDRLEPLMRTALDVSAANHAPNIITFSGNRKGMSDTEGADNCVAFLNRIKGYAEEKGVTICMELLNSKVDHKDYMCDHTAWGVGVMKRVDSPRIKLLYDIYHLQIMEGDIARTIRENIRWIGHFHTGGNPGRHEIDSTQELNYRFVATVIADLGFTGYVAHEYSPARGHDALKSLDEAMDIFDV
jgi:hydroxypyruvate isomerase